MKKQIKYETIICSRCGGTGHYSYNSYSGTVCFKCNGRKRVFSNNALRAKEKIHEFIRQNYGKTPAFLEEGDRMYVSHLRKWAVVTAKPQKGGTIIRRKDGTQEQQYNIPLRGVTIVEGPNSLIPVIPRDGRFQTEVIPYAERLPGVEIIDA